MTSTPLKIGIITDNKTIDSLGYNVLGEKYLHAVTTTMNAAPVILPVTMESWVLEHLVGTIDGLLLTGSISNIEPSLYLEKNTERDPVRDPARDQAALWLIEYAINKKIPVFAICRGFQEINVALGGTLHQNIREITELYPHAPLNTPSHDENFAPRHSIELQPEGILATCSLHGEEQVNSLHGQGIKKLAPRLIVEAIAPDGLIEAYRYDDESQFLLGVQWHPEWKPQDNSFYTEIFQRFKSACISFSENPQNKVLRKNNDK